LIDNQKITLPPCFLFGLWNVCSSSVQLVRKHQLLRSEGSQNQQYSRNVLTSPMRPFSGRTFTVGMVVIAGVSYMDSTPTQQVMWRYVAYKPGGDSYVNRK